MNYEESTHTRAHTHTAYSQLDAKSTQSVLIAVHRFLFPFWIFPSLISQSSVLLAFSISLSVCVFVCLQLAACIWKTANTSHLLKTVKFQVIATKKPTNPKTIHSLIQSFSRKKKQQQRLVCVLYLHWRFVPRNEGSRINSMQFYRLHVHHPYLAVCFRVRVEKNKTFFLDCRARQSNLIIKKLINI